MPSRASQSIPAVFLALLLSVGGSPTSANAQVVSVSGISGLVTDATGAVITEASVVVKNSDTGGTWNTTTNDSGVYNFPVLPPGRYTITVSRTGFKSAVVSNRTIQVAQPAHVDVVLPIGEISERVTVSAEGNELLTTATAEIATTVTPTLVKNLPVSRRNFLDLTTVTPGVISQTLAAYGGGPGISQAASSLNYVQAAGTVMQSSVFIAGNRDSANNISVDGGNIQSALYQDTMQLQSPASIQELKVETANMSAEFGNGVAAINVITKSGTNEYHGELYEYFRNNKLDANGFFNNLAGRALPHYSQNQFGAAAGGPIKKDKLLVFGNYEGLRVRHDSVSIQTVPPSDVRLGDFSNYRPPRPGLPNQFLPTPTIYNPYQFDSRTGLRQPFPGNKIPMGPTNLCAPRPTCVDPVAAALLKDWVLQPNTVIDGIPRLVGNSRSTINADQMKVATVYQWAFSIQQRLSSVWGMELNYLGSHTIRSFQYMDMNSPALPQGPLANLSLQQRRRWPQWGSLQTWAPLGWGRYNGFIAGIKNNTWHGLTLLANYTWAKNIVSSHWGFSDIGNIDYRNIYIWAGPYMSTPYHRFVAGYSYALPLGRGKALVNSAPSVVELLVSGWTFSGITTFSLGAPQAVQGRDLSGTANVGMPDRICDPTKGFTKSRLMWFNTACFVDTQYGVYGNSPLGVINLPGINNWDLTLSKFTKTNFPKETGQVEFRAELFNAFNHTQWGGPSQSTTSATFGQITATRPPRQLQLALRYIF